MKYSNSIQHDANELSDNEILNLVHLLPTRGNQAICGAYFDKAT
jgi:hypothetical protein